VVYKLTVVQDHLSLSTVLLQYLWPNISQHPQRRLPRDDLIVNGGIAPQVNEPHNANGGL